MAPNFYWPIENPAGCEEVVLGPGIKCKLNKYNICVICLEALKQLVHLCFPFPAVKTGSNKKQPSNNKYIHTYIYKA